MQIEIIKAGIFTTVQDAGRHCYRELGVPVSGVMDEHSARIANMVIGNADHCALIEFTFGGAEFRTITEVLIAYAGGGAVYKVNDQLLEPGRPIYIPANQVVTLMPDQTGYRSYLSVMGGWNVPVVMKSRSTYVTAAIGGYEGRRLKAGDKLTNDEQEYTALSRRIFNSLEGNVVKQTSWRIKGGQIFPSHNQVISVLPGREFNWFDEEEASLFFSESFTISLNSNRMGYRLEGPSIPANNKSEMLSTAVLPGCIQVTRGGEMILLMADCQTTGGYPRIAQVILVDLPLCGQLRPGQQIKFKRVERGAAEEMYLQWRKDMDQLSQSIKIKYDIHE